MAQGGGRRRFSRADPPPYTPSADDTWCNETREMAGLSIGNWLWQSQVTNRPIHTLQRWELAAMAEAAIMIYVRRCSERWAEEEKQKQSNEPESSDRLASLLDG